MSDTSQNLTFAVIAIYRKPTDAEVAAGIAKKEGRVLDSGLDAKVAPGGLIYLDNKFDADLLAGQIRDATGLLVQTYEQKVTTIGDWLRLFNDKLLKAMDDRQIALEAQVKTLEAQLKQAKAKEK